MLPLLLSNLTSESDRYFVETMYSTYKKAMYAEAKKYLGKSSDIADVLQQTWIQLIDHIDKWRGLEPMLQSQYLVAMTRCVAVAEKQRIYEEHHYSLEDKSFVEGKRLHTTDDVVDLVVRHDIVTRLRMVLNELPEGERMILEFFYVLNYSVNEINAYTNIPAAEIEVIIKSTRDYVLSRLT